MPASKLANVQQVVFTNTAGTTLQLDAQVLEWSDTRKPRYALHEYLKRDGAEAEYMGRAPHRVRFNIVYLGSSWKDDFNRLVAAIDEAPTGTLTHPFLGSLSVICDGIEGTQVNVENAINMVLVPISFVENSISAQKIQVSSGEGPQTKGAKVNSYCSALSIATQIYATASSAVTQFITTALQYSAAAVNTAYATGTPDPSLPGLLGQTMIAAGAAFSALRLDPLWPGDALGFPALQNLELVLGACTELDASLKQITPIQTQYSIPTATTLLALAQQFYGTDAASRMAEIIANNPGKITNPALIPGGTVLIMGTPTVKQL